MNPLKSQDNNSNQLYKALSHEQKLADNWSDNAKKSLDDLLKGPEPKSEAELKSFYRKLKSSAIPKSSKKRIEKAIQPTLKVNKTKKRKRTETKITHENLTPTRRRIGKLKMGKNYRRVELLDVTIERKRRHLYPTKKVRKIFKTFQADKESYESFQSYLESTGKIKDISIKTDTTLYIPIKWLRENKMVKVVGQSLIRQGNPLTEGKKYIFVINQDDELIVSEKKRESKHGRIQHSSLSQGKDVQLAGTITVENGKIILTNESGHYKPSGKDLDLFSEWLTRQGVTVQNVSVKTYDSGYDQPTREVALRFHWK